MFLNILMLIKLNVIIKVHDVKNIILVFVLLYFIWILQYKWNN